MSLLSYLSSLHPQSQQVASELGGHLCECLLFTPACEHVIKIIVNCGYGDRAHELTLKSFWKQQFNYGRGAFHFEQKRNKQNLDQAELRSWRFYLNLLLYPFRQYQSPRSLTIAFLFLLSQLAIGAGLLAERSR